VYVVDPNIALAYDQRVRTSVLGTSYQDALLGGRIPSGLEEAASQPAEYELLPQLVVLGTLPSARKRHI
jgi:hypothetical protein